MDYEKKYKEALERAKEIIECSKSDTKEVRMVLSFFPELTESEGERIRKEILHYIKTGTYKKDWILWLEKQGEQKPAEWSNEDEKFFKTALWHISYSISNGKSTDIHCDTTDWFKSLKDRVQPQPKQEWSEEDVKMIENIIDTINISIKDCDIDDIGTKARFSLEKERDWLKNKLKFLKPQSHWKPSNEQMEALKFCIEHNIDNEGILGSKVVKLFNELKKL